MNFTFLPLTYPTAAHMHDGGSKMVLFINEKEMCVSRATYGQGGDNNNQTIVGLSICPAVISFKKGDVMTMDAVYDLGQHPLYVSRRSLN
jgi:hypothetical protein